MMKNSIKNFKRSQSFYSFIGLALVFVIASLIVKEFLTFNIITVYGRVVYLILSTD